MNPIFDNRFDDMFKDDMSEDNKFEDALDGVFETNDGLPGTRLTTGERESLIKAFAVLLERGDWNEELHTAELRDGFLDFLLGLSFPQAVNCGEELSKEREILTALSICWHLHQLDIQTKIHQTLQNIHQSLQERLEANPQLRSAIEKCN